MFALNAVIMLLLRYIDDKYNLKNQIMFSVNNDK